MDFSALPVYCESDIVVCGGGTAGAFAAIAAADQGANVLIIEQFGSLGGTATNGLVTPLMTTHIPGNPQASYISNRVRDKMYAYGAANKEGSRFDPLVLRIVLEELCFEAGVKVLYHTFIPEVCVENGKVTSVVIANKSGLSLVKGKIFIDCTGDGDVSVRAGAEYTKGNPDTGKNQPISLRYIIAGVDYNALGEFFRSEVKRTGIDSAAYVSSETEMYGAVTGGGKWTLSDLFQKAIAAGDLDPEDELYWQAFAVPGRKGVVAFNNPEFFDKVDATDPDTLSFTQIDGKRRIMRQLQFYKKYMKGFENAFIDEIAEMVGIRESRNIKAEYVLTAADIICRRKFEDAICQSCYPVDIHGKQLNFDRDAFKPVDDGKPYYEIPYRTLVVHGFDNLMVAGRCLGAEFLAQSSLRIQPSCRSAGEAAGIGAAFALKQDKLPREIDGKTVRAEMKARGAVFAD